MRYLVIDGNQNEIFSLGKCICKSTGCNDDHCGQNSCFLNQGSMCPKHCWAQVCIKAKIDPFSVLV